MAYEEQPLSYQRYLVWRKNNKTSVSQFLGRARQNYAAVWIDIAVGWVVLVTLVASAAFLERGGVLAPIVLLSAPIGFFIAYIHLFMHEAAHYGLAPRKNLNDRLANIFIGSLLALDVKRYRQIHMLHHKHHGDSQDAENVYLNRLTLRFLVETLFLITPLKVVRRRMTALQKQPVAKEDAPKRSKLLPLATLSIHAAVLISLLSNGLYVTAVTWIIGIVSWFPLFAALRPMLEHRRQDAPIDPSVEHGPYNRMFKRTLFARFFGGAGFHLHLLHHLEPSVPYTALPLFKEELANLGLANELELSESTYAQTFRTLYEA
jgi:fatty acid desaturase